MKTNPLKKIGKASCVANEIEHLQNLISWQHTCNAYILELSSIFSNTAPDHLVCVTDTLAHIYGMPTKAEKVYNIIESFPPTSDSAVGLSFASELAEREIFELSLKSVADGDTCKIQLTEKAFEDTLINMSIITRIVRKMDGIKFFQSEPVFEHNESINSNFDSDDAFNFLFSLLEIEPEKGAGLTPLVEAQENCHHFIFNAVESLSEIEDMTERREAARKAIADIQRVIKTLTARLK